MHDDPDTAHAARPSGRAKLVRMAVVFVLVVVVAVLVGRFGTATDQGPATDGVPAAPAAATG